MFTCPYWQQSRQQLWRILILSALGWLAAWTGERVSWRSSKLGGGASEIINAGNSNNSYFITCIFFQITKCHKSHGGGGKQEHTRSQNRRAHYSLSPPPKENESIAATRERERESSSPD